ncbi:uncharacterized protein IWZ02DRAFT_264839 [Phyllosticta citriasiana]|uniref:uncharacterized protein n=1 Tax=Phyllosticta citriasiana TaxID=595635 RepID=UPI0030FDDED0
MFIVIISLFFSHLQGHRVLAGAGMRCISFRVTSFGLFGRNMFTVFGAGHKNGGSLDGRKDAMCGDIQRVTSSAGPGRYLRQRYDGTFFPLRFYSQLGNVIR